MPTISRRKLLVGGLVAGVGGYYFNLLPGLTSTDTHSERIVHTNEPKHFQGEGDQSVENIEIAGDGATLITSRVSSNEDFIIDLYNEADYTRYTIHRGGDGNTTETLHNLPPGDYGIITQRNPGDWEVEIIDYETVSGDETVDVDSTPTYNDEGTGIIGPIAFDVSTPTEINVDFSGRDTHTIEFYDSEGSMQKYVETRPSADSLSTREQVGGEGFIRVVTTSTWEMELE